MSKDPGPPSPPSPATPSSSSIGAPPSSGAAPSARTPPASTSPAATAPGGEALLAYRVFKGDLYAGALGSLPGRFVSSRDIRESGGAHLAAGRFTSSHFILEREVLPLLRAAKDFPDAAARLRAAGFRLEEARYIELFDVPVGGPSPSEEDVRDVQDSVRDLNRGKGY